MEPLACLTCPACGADTVFALRTADTRNHCHCSTCGHVWRDEYPAVTPSAEVPIRRKRDRRQHLSAESHQPHKAQP